MYLQGRKRDAYVKNNMWTYEGRRGWGKVGE